MSQSHRFHTTRRGLIFRTGPAIALTGLTATQASAEKPAALATSEPRPLSGLEGEALWHAVQAEFELRPGYLPFNAANMAPPCAGTRRILAAGTDDIDADPSFENRAKYRDLHEQTRRALAALIGADAEMIALTRNTTESNNTIVNGLDLCPDDEVVLWSQNHRTNLQSWQVRAAREGFMVKLVETPEQPQSEYDLIAPFRAAMSDRTRVLSFSHVSNNSGTALPAAALCALASDKGALSMVDGAQTVGAMALDLDAMGCDVYTSSGQKWICGPREAGFLFVRPSAQDQLNTNMTGYALAGSSEGARKFETLGQRDDAAVVALRGAANLHLDIGPATGEARVRERATRLMQLIQARVPEVAFVTPTNPAFRLGVVITKLKGIEPAAAQAQVYERHGISGSAFPGALRLCPHIYHSDADLELAALAVTELFDA